MPKFINPYNFIPLGKDKSVDESDSADRNLTGVIEYSLLTKTPLFIPNTSNDKTFSVIFGTEVTQEDKSDHKSYDFFSYNNLKGDGKYDDEYFAPVIPGSEMRGMIRNNYEILTNSCLSAVDDIDLSKRTSHVFKAGLLMKVDDGYKLFEADDCLLRSKNNNGWKKAYVTDSYKEGDEVRVDIEKRIKGKDLVLSINESTSSKIGYIIKGEAGPELPQRLSDKEKHCAHVFLEPTKNAECIKLNSSDIKRLKKVISIYQDNDPSAYKEYAHELDGFINGNKNEGGYFPVYYDYDENIRVLYLSPASITRELYSKKVSVLIGSFAQCCDKNNLCPACSVFGTVNESKNKIAVASRLRFSDLSVISDKEDNREYYDKVITLPELSSPKLNNMEFYMRKPADNAVFWTYDYYIDNKGKTHKIENAMINGRKFYWHNLKCDINSVEANKRNMTIRPLKKDIMFRGRIFFEEISERELRRLIWILNAGEEVASINNAEHGYKLGSGKPLGLGSVAVHTDKVMIKEIQIKGDFIDYVESEYNYDTQDIASEQSVLFDDDVCKNYMVMTNFKAVDSIRIKYPVPDNKDDAEGFEWFASLNHKAYSLDKATGNKKSNKFPNKRNQEYFAWYMEPMNPELKKTNIDVMDNNFKKNNNKNNKNNNKRYR